MQPIKVFFSWNRAEHRRRFHVLGAAALAAAGSLGVSAYAQAKPPNPEQFSPGQVWQTETPESVDFSTARFAALTALLKTEPTTAMLVAVHGKVVYSYVDVNYVSSIASVRKSVLDMLFGVPRYAILDHLNETVKQIGIEEMKPLLPIEQGATLEDLLASRSGIFIVPAKPDPWSADAYQPPRGSALPGVHFTYNEWDFNAAGVAFEKLTGRKIDDALADDLAAPLQLQDFHRSLQVENAATATTNPAGYPMMLSTRDMARLGQLMLRQGNWNGTQVISGDWTRYSTLLWTPFAEMNPDGLRTWTQPARWGFGLMWFVWDEPPFLHHHWTGPMQGAFIAMGSGGQYIAILPELDMVVAHKVDLSPGHSQMDPVAWDAILNLIIAAHCEQTCPAALSK